MDEWYIHTTRTKGYCLEITAVKNGEANAQVVVMEPISKRDLQIVLRCLVDKLD